MNLRNIFSIEDSLSKSRSIVFHSTSSKELYDIIVNRKFHAGRAGGSMLGSGFYANQHLYQAQKGNYGPFILKAELANVDKFFFCNLKMYNEFFGTSYKTLREIIELQLKSKGRSIEDTKEASRFLINTDGASDSAAMSFSGFWSVIKSLGFHGLVYFGNYDRESVVCWIIKDVIPLAYSTDKGETWTKPTKENIRAEVESSYKESKESNLKSSDEYKRSYQRAYDLKSKYEGKPDDKIISAIKSHLSRITDPMKKAIRKEVFEEIFPNLDLSIVTDSTWRVWYPEKGKSELSYEDFSDEAVARDFMANFPREQVTLNKIEDVSPDVDLAPVEDSAKDSIVNVPAKTIAENIASCLKGTLDDTTSLRVKGLVKSVLVKAYPVHIGTSLLYFYDGVFDNSYSAKGYNKYPGFTVQTSNDKIARYKLNTHKDGFTTAYSRTIEELAEHIKSNLLK